MPLFGARRVPLAFPEPRWLWLPDFKVMKKYQERVDMFIAFARADVDEAGEDDLSTQIGRALSDELRSTLEHPDPDPAEAFAFGARIGTAFAKAEERAPDVDPALWCAVVLATTADQPVGLPGDLKYWIAYAILVGFYIGRTSLNELDDIRHAVRQDLRRSGLPVSGGEPGVDILGRPFGTLDEIEDEVATANEQKQRRLVEVQAQLAALDESTPSAVADELRAERKKILTYQWLAAGGDRRGVPPPT